MNGMLLPLTLRLLLEDEVAGELRRSQLEVLTEEATVRSGLVSTRSVAVSTFWRQPSLRGRPTLLAGSVSARSVIMSLLDRKRYETFRI